MTDTLDHRVVLITRTYDAPRQLVFRAFTEAQHLSQWWGPDQFVTTVLESDPRPEGLLRLVMRGPDGAENPMSAVYREVRPPEFLLLESSTTDPEGRLLLKASHSVRLEEREGRTEVTVRAEASALTEDAIAMLGGMRAGWNQSLQCLEDALSGSGERQILVTRLLPAVPEVVFPLWTQPEHLARWWGPEGFSITTHEIDVRPGGTWRFTMHGPGDVNYPNTIVYDEISPPERLRYTHQSPHFQTTVTFDQMDGMTALSMRNVFDSVEQLQASVEQFHARTGAEQTLDRLAEVVQAGVGSV
ncbi:MAG: SRPBCC domain-containing protein [Candidatus Dormibacteria bacterium]